MDHAFAHPQASADFVAAHAAELDAEVQRQHIELYVNSFTRELGEEGYAAAEELLTRAFAAGLVPALGNLRD